LDDEEEEEEITMSAKKRKAVQNGYVLEISWKVKFVVCRL
jgi:hypothetical protein